MKQDTRKNSKGRPESLAERVYQSLKNDIFDFRLMPGDRFSESEIAERMDVSRTPVRQALFRLERGGYVDVYFRSGWQVRPFDFAYFEELYDFRIVLECEAVRLLCGMAPGRCAELLADLKRFWIDDPRLDDGKTVSRHDEGFHMHLVAAAGNRQMERVHAELTEKIRIIRRLDFTRADRVDATYNEHARILLAVLQQHIEEAQRILTDHISQSKAEVRKITLHMLQQARP
ncbi:MULTISPECIES: GntR family transcriptional regulator [Brenneria]|uniref:GntR family transcriptional regulator n=1 Tax=Brenneria nigrifluens DSM 30175 = ATCC 13028 TaxID=1121120 RepID=A0A2U1UCR0_9GAMM|nr:MULTISPECIES: GntR family transcriptional regulator [Brenneria]EHD21351.1 transcriptional regulator, GntR family [Brenneria sp. EniD312]PWC19392.1 GntR family transcriptional regulator [Brenneria nigrifluens DSM 30175 = ATCC 13028]PWC20080.1 GntR family transcriptional regulator [Brenneria nigrifluens DSM 30175 = ATCC 13028]QCR04484.1 GntR family transcriptional regulator [Brenneria nigrifluens DSM 30175 = ATCC 13028]